MLDKMPGVCYNEKTGRCARRRPARKVNKKANRQGGGTHWLGAVNFRGRWELHPQRSMLVILALSD